MNFIVSPTVIITFFASELLRLMPEAFFPNDLSHLPNTFTSGLGRYANRRRGFGLCESEHLKHIPPTMRKTHPDDISHPGYPIVFINQADNRNDAYWRAFVDGDPFGNDPHFWESCKNVSVSYSFLSLDIYFFWLTKFYRNSKLTIFFQFFVLFIR